MMSLADGGDLPEVMTTVNQLEHSPLAGAEGTEDWVASAAVIAEEGFGLAADCVETCEVLGSGPGEFVAGEQMDC